MNECQSCLCSLKEENTVNMTSRCSLPLAAISVVSDIQRHSFRTCLNVVVLKFCGPQVETSSHVKINFLVVWHVQIFFLRFVCGKFAMSHAR